MLYWDLFFSFLKVGLFSIGGGYAAMPIIQSQTVENHGWLTMGEFTDLLTIAEMTPGPIAVNSATFVGIRIGGIRGAVVATLGCILPSIFIVSALTAIYRRYKNLAAMQSVLSSLRPAVVSLIASAGLTILLHVMFQGNRMQIKNLDWISTILFMVAFIALRKWKWNPVWTMVFCGGLYLGICQIT